MDWFVFGWTIWCFAIGYWTCGFFARNKTIRSARKAAETRRINKLKKED